MGFAFGEAGGLSVFVANIFGSRLSGLGYTRSISVTGAPAGTMG